MKDNPETLIELQNVFLRRGDAQLLENISWTVRAGEHWTLLGANGSGKTLTLKIVLGYIWPTSGSVSVLGHPFGSIDLRELRRRIGWVSSDLQQQLNRRKDKALSVVVSGHYAALGVHRNDFFWETKPPELEERAKEKLSLLGADSLSGREFPTLSFGEQKRVMIARALMSEPDLLVLDEPCTGLDIAARERFLQSLQEFAEKREQSPTMIFVTHHTEEIMPFISHCHIIKDGRTLAEGNCDECLSSENMSEALGMEINVSKRDGRYWTGIEEK